MDLEQYKKELAEQGYAVHKKEELEKLIDNSAAERVDRAIKERDKEFYSSWDNEIISLVGEEKPADVKTKEFIVNKFQQLKSAAEEAKDLKSKIHELEKGSGNEDLIEQYKSQLEEVRKESESLEDKYKALLEEEKSKFSRTLKQKEVLTNMDKLSFNEEMDEDIISTYKDKAVSKVLEYKSEYRDGKLVFLDEEGQVMRNKENALDPYTIQELLAKELKPVLRKKETKTGTGTKPPAATTPKVDDNKLPIPERIFRSRTEASEYAVEKGLRGTDMMKFMLKHAADLPLK